MVEYKSALAEIMDAIEAAADDKSKSLVLAQAKKFILDTMTNEMIREAFVKEQENFKILFQLKMLRKQADETDGFSEPYEIMEKIFSAFSSLIELVEEFGEQILFLINQDQDEQVKHLCVERMSQFTSILNIHEFEDSPDPCWKLTHLITTLKAMLPKFVRQIPECNVQYSEKLGILFCHLTTRLNKFESVLIEKYHNMTAVFSSTVFDDNAELLHEFQRASKSSKTVQIRVIEIAVQLGAISREHLISISEQCFSLDSNLRELLHSQDILAKLNVIEIISNLATTFHGYEYLLHKGHLQSLFKEITTLGDLKDPLSGFTETATMKLFSHMAKLMPDRVQNDFSDYYNLLFKYISYEDVRQHEIQVNLAIQTFVYFLESNTLKKFIHENYQTQFFNVLQRMVHILMNYIDEEMKSECLTCIAEIIALDPSLLHAEHNEQKWLDSPWIESMSELSETFYNNMVSQCTHDKLFSYCLKLGKEPFLKTRLASQLYFKALAQSKWGLTLLFSENKFLKKNQFLREYLVNREVEIENEGLQSKYDLIKLICANFKQNYELFPKIGEYNLEELEEYLRLGPLYKPTPYKVAFESN